MLAVPSSNTAARGLSDNEGSARAEPSRERQGSADRFDPEPIQVDRAPVAEVDGRAPAWPAPIHAVESRCTRDPLAIVQQGSKPRRRVARCCKALPPRPARFAPTNTVRWR